MKQPSFAPINCLANFLCTATLVCLSAVLSSANAQSTSAPKASEQASSARAADTKADTKSGSNAKADLNELTYVANADNCSAKALHPPVDHGPRASTSAWLNASRVAECYSRVR